MTDGKLDRILMLAIDTLEKQACGFKKTLDTVGNNDKIELLLNEINKEIAEYQLKRLKLACKASKSLDGSIMLYGAEFEHGKLVKEYQDTIDIQTASGHYHLQLTPELIKEIEEV